MDDDDDDDDEEEEEEVEEDDEGGDDDEDDNEENDGDAEMLDTADGGDETRVVLHEDKKYYPTAMEVYGEEVCLLTSSD